MVLIENNPLGRPFYWLLPFEIVAISDLYILSGHVITWRHMRQRMASMINDQLSDRIETVNSR